MITEYKDTIKDVKLNNVYSDKGSQFLYYFRNSVNLDLGIK